MGDAGIRETSSRKVKSGETMVVKVMEPPIPEPYRRIDRLYWWEDLREKVLQGAYSRSSLDRFFVGEIGGEFAGCVLCIAPTDTRDVGLVSFVYTEPEHRTKGVMTQLLGALIEDFDRGGGKMIHLCTANPVAFDLYSKAGFVPLIGDGMRYLSPGNEDFDEAYLAYAGKATVRKATFGDMARFVVLYNNPRLDWFVRYYIPFDEWRVFKNFRFEGHYRRLIKDAERGAGRLLVLENPERRVVAGASLTEVPSYHEQHVSILNIISSPSYFDELDTLLEAIVGEAESDATEIIQIYLADFEQDKKDILESVAFVEGARLRDYLKLDGGETRDMLVYTRRLDASRTVMKGPDQYYGGAWSAN